MQSRILLCDDDALVASVVALALRDAGFAVTETTTVQQCLDAAHEHAHELALIDVMMPPGPLSWQETKGGFGTGVAVARRLRDIRPGLKIVGISQAANPDSVQWFQQHAHGVFSKRDVFSAPERLARLVTRLLSPDQWWATLHSFIVHGHDHDTRDALEQYLVGHLGLPSPKILGNLASSGLTLIEKLEEIGGAVDIVFVLFTPDDVVTTPEGAAIRQARPNVLLETGYFLGLLARRSGRVILLSKGAQNVPSDLLGVGHIDISEGIAEAGSEIRREIAAVRFGS